MERLLVEGSLKNRADGVEIPFQLPEAVWSLLDPTIQA
jgi:hypothetical protein